MPIENPRGLPFSVDTWSAVSKRKRYHFLTHAHKDHLAGIASFSSGPIYCSLVTKILVLHQFPQMEESLFVEIKLGKSVIINDPDGDFSVTAFDANHCPGAVMFLFEGEFGNILHTGDCRLSPECVQNLPLKYISKKGRESRFDYLFLDCTFGRCPLKMPVKQLAIQQVISCIWKHPNAPFVYLACDLLGQEDILVQVSKTFGSKIYVDKTLSPECFLAISLTAPEILSEDASSRFQLTEGFPKLKERASKKIAEARYQFQPEPIFLRPSTQWYATNIQAERLRLSEAERDEFGVWHVCYSMHSSREELEWALQLLKPKWVISTTPPCRAMELDYVKKHCYKTRITHDDPIWKLFKVSRAGKSIYLPASKNSVTLNNRDANVIEVSQSINCSFVELKDLTIDQLELKLDLSPPSPPKPITLFGRARLGVQCIDILEEEKTYFFETFKNMSELVNSQEVVDATRSSLSLESEDLEKPDENDTKCRLNHANSCSGQSEEIDKKKHEIYSPTEISDVTEPKEDTASGESDLNYIGSSKNINASLRRLYRSMNVPVPRPLPSLLELMKSTKRVKVGSHSSFSKD